MSEATAMLDELQRTINTELPVTQHLGITVGSFQGGTLTLAAPLRQNVNHKGHAFAGSINAVATLAGWSWVWLLLRRESLAGHVVIQDSAVHYERPVSTDFEATCPAPAPEAISRLVSALRRRGRGRIALEVTVRDAEGPAVRFSGRYVVHRTASNA